MRGHAFSPPQQTTIRAWTYQHFETRWAQQLCVDLRMQMWEGNETNLEYGPCPVTVAIGGPIMRLARNIRRPSDAIRRKPGNPSESQWRAENSCLEEAMGIECFFSWKSWHSRHSHTIKWYKMLIFLMFLVILFGFRFSFNWWVLGSPLISSFSTSKKPPRVSKSS